MAADLRDGHSWAKDAFMPFSAGLVAGVRLVQDPNCDQKDIEEAFASAVENFPRPELERERHDEMADLYERGLREAEIKMQYDRTKLLDFECSRDPRATDYIYEPFHTFEMDNASEFTIAAFQAGLIAGARLLTLGHVQPDDTTSALRAISLAWVNPITPGGPWDISAGGRVQLPDANLPIEFDDEEALWIRRRGEGVLGQLGDRVFRREDASEIENLMIGFEALEGLARIRMSRGDFDRARLTAIKGVGIASHAPQPWLLLAEVDANAGEHGRAHSWLKRADETASQLGLDEHEWQLMSHKVRALVQ
jgi:hypothetical protein